jgi:hypothetical protein
MEWFRHDSNANLDEKLQEVLLDYGLEGYGLYWYCLELIVGKTSADNITFELKHDARIIARNTGSTVQRVEEMMKRFITVGLFENDGNKITCLKVAKRLMTSATSNQKMRNMIQDIRQNHDGVMTSCDSVMREEKRIDKKEKKDRYIPPIPAELFTEYQAIRKSKRAAPFTERMFNSLCKQASLAGITPEKAITICCEKGWTGFEASWLKQDKQASTLNAALSVFKPQYIAEQTAHIKLVGDNNADF